MQKLFVLLLVMTISTAAQTAPPAKSASKTPAKDAPAATPKVTQPAQSAAVDNQASPEEVNQLLVLLKSRQQMETVLAGFKEQMSRGQMQGFQLALQKKGITLSDADMARAKLRLDAITEELFKQIPYDEMMASTAEIYRKHFTSDDVKALTAFYSSPAGQKFLAEMPSLVQESMRAGGEIMGKRMPEILDRVEKRVEELSDEFAKNPPAAKKP